jgi:hypothetical protein
MSDRQKGNMVINWMNIMQDERIEMNIMQDEIIESSPSPFVWF